MQQRDRFAFCGFADGRASRLLSEWDESGGHIVSRDLEGGPVTTILPSKAVDQETTNWIGSSRPCPPMGGWCTRCRNRSRTTPHE